MKRLLSIFLISVSLGLISSPTLAAPSQCSLTFGGGKKYADYEIHKGLVTNDNTNGSWVGGGYDSAWAAEEALLRWCKRKEGSPCRLVDVDGKQCGNSGGSKSGGSTAKGATLKVSSPNGGESWTTGKKYIIKWSKGKGGASVKIQLLKSGKAYKTIVAKTKNDGRHRWKVPATIAKGSAYKIKITSASKKKVTDQSDSNFTIAKKVKKTKKTKKTKVSKTKSKSGKKTGRVSSVGTGSEFRWDSAECEVVAGKTMWSRMAFVHRGCAGFPSTSYCLSQDKFFMKAPSDSVYAEVAVKVVPLPGCTLRDETVKSIWYSTKDWLCSGDAVKINGKNCVIDKIY